MTGHEESYTDNSMAIGVMVNMDENHQRVDSFLFMFKNKTYTFFNTIFDLNDFLLYQDSKTKRAYMKEEIFDLLYDNPIEGKFEDHLTWTP